MFDSLDLDALVAREDNHETAARYGLLDEVIQEEATEECGS